MELGDVLTVQQSAERLGLPAQRVRELVQRGELAGERVGPIWMISTSDVERMRLRNRPVGRPLSERLAWAVLSPSQPTLKSRVATTEDGSRAIRYAQKPFSELVERLRRRSDVHFFSTDPQRLRL